MKETEIRRFAPSVAAEGQRGGVEFLADALVNGVVGHDKSALAEGQKIASGGDGGVRAVPVVYISGPIEWVQ